MDEYIQRFVLPQNKTMTVLNNQFVRLKQVFLLKKIYPCLLIAILPALLFYISSILILKSYGFEIVEILRDPAQQFNTSSFFGFLSNIGIWLWVSSTAICFFTILTNGYSIEKQQKQLLLLTGLLSLILAIDDFFLIHDRYIRQSLCYLVYAILASAILIRHYKQILEMEGFAYILAGSLLALSILTDLVQSKLPFSYSSSQVLEEGFKFSGAAAWLYFNSKIASQRKLVYLNKDN